MYSELVRNSYIYQYNEAIKRGWLEIDGVKKPLIVGAKIKKVMAKLMGYFEDPRIEFNPKECYRRFKFQEKLCFQGKAPFYNKPISLMLWQKAFYEAIYSFYEKETGLRLITYAELEVARKNGKSTMIASDINVDLFIGEGGINICCCSNDDRQAKFIWGECKGMCKRLDKKEEITATTVNVIRNEKKNVEILRLSEKTQNKDGFNFKKVCHDEKHDAKKADVKEAAILSMSTHDENLYIGVSTNGFVNGGLYDNDLEYANSWLNDEIDDIHFVAFLFEQDSEAECWGDIHLLEKSNPSLIYGVKKYKNIEASRKRALIDKEKRMHFLTKDCNIKVSNSQAWLTLEEYDYSQERFTLNDFRGHTALGAVDLSDCGDLTVSEALFMRAGDPVKYVVPQFFIPQSKLDDKDNGAKYKEWANTINPVTGKPYVIVIKGNKINQKHVADWYQSLRNEYGINTIMIGYDKWHSDIFLMHCDKKNGYGFNTMPITQHPKVMSYPMKTVERDLHAKLINYCNNPVMKYCFNNTSAEIKNDLIMPCKIDGQYSRKIDGVVALIILYATLEKNELTFNQYLK